ncbi:putative DNA primase/helicase [Anaerotaenia torta]|uniref:DNA primase family protein n=1 Tax=Anaerotaenia torta TaxID=433293 RepID=UPI003D1FAB55
MKSFNEEGEDRMDRSESKGGKISSYEISQIIMEKCRCANIDGVVSIYDEVSNDYTPIDSDRGEYIIRNSMDEGIKLYIGTFSIREAVKWIKSDQKLIYVEAKDLQQRNYYLNYLDGLVNIASSEVIQRKTPEFYFTYHLNMKRPGTFDKEKFEESEYYKFLKRTFDDKKQRDTFEEIVGLCISNIRNRKISLFFYGPSNSGKSVALSLIKNIVGNKFVSAVSFSQLGEEFTVAQLFGKHLNVSGEMSGIANKRIDIFKSLTGSDAITVCYKGQDHFVFDNKALFLFACNELPIVAKATDADEAFFKRMRILPFKNVVDPEDIIDNLAERLLEERELIVSRAMEALKRLKENNFVFSNQKEMNKVVEGYINDVNSFLAFAQKHIRRNPKKAVASCQLEKYYRLFCDKKGVDVMYSSSWSRILKSIFHVTRKNITNDPSVPYNSRGYKGIELVDLDELEERGQEVTDEQDTTKELGIFKKKHAI